MHKITATAIALTLAITAATLTGTSAQATSHPPAAANGSRTHQHVKILRLIDKVDSNSNIEIDLGAPGLSAGDQQVFRDRWKIGE